MDGGDRSLLDVGRIVKAHGIRGEVAVVFSTNHPDRVAPGTVYETEQGQLTVLRAKPFQQGYLVLFEGVPDRNHAELLRGRTLRAERLELEDEEDVIWIDDLFEAVVETTDGVIRGRVLEVEENPASDLLVLDSGHLVPLTFVVEVIPNVRIVVEAPEGLFE